MSIPTVPLGTQGLQVSKQGLGCMGMSAFYGSDDENEAVATLERALELGVTFWDTAELYGGGANEELIARVLGHRRDQVTLATKFGVVPDPKDPDNRDKRVTDGSPANVRRSVDASLSRLGADHIDLFYQHRPDPRTPIEETVGALSDAVRAGKIRYYGLSEVTPELVRRAHAVHPLTAVQSEYSLWTREGVEELLPVQRELGIGPSHLVRCRGGRQGTDWRRAASAQLGFTAADRDEYDVRLTFPVARDGLLAGFKGWFVAELSATPGSTIPPARPPADPDRGVPGRAD